MYSALSMLTVTWYHVFPGTIPTMQHVVTVTVVVVNHCEVLLSKQEYGKYCAAKHYGVVSVQQYS